MWNITYKVGENENYSIPRHSDKAILPEYILEDIMKEYGDDDKLPHPFIFRVNTINSSCYIGVKEFSSVNEMVLPLDIEQRLGLKNEAQLHLELTSVTNNDDAFIQIKPRHSVSTSWKIILEARLPQFYTVVTTGDTLYFPVGDKEYVIDVVKVNGRSVCIVDQDIELRVDDVINDEETSDKEERWPFAYETIDVSRESLIKGIKIDQGIKVKVSVEKGESISSNGDFVIGDQFLQFNWCSVEVTPNKENEKKWINDSESREAIVYSLMPMSLKLSNGLANGITEGIAPDKFKCQNCSNIVSINAKVMHETFCQRNTIKCEKGCNQTFLRQIPETHWHCCDNWGNGFTELSIHEFYLHDNGNSSCPKCEANIPSNNLALGFHIGVECPEASHICRYCHLLLPKGEPSLEAKYHNMSEHEWTCGSKTIRCDHCSKSIRLRDYQVHMQLHESLKREQAEPSVCENPLCVKIRNSNNDNALGLCDVCFGPLYSNVLDLDGKQLKNRVERRLILQLKNGCRRNNCENKLCGTSPEKIEGLENMTKIVKFVKELPVEQYQFCVVESMSVKRRIVSLLKDRGWQYGWRCKAVEVCGVDVNKAERWLEINGN